MSALDTQLGFRDEPTGYGSGGTVTRFAEFDSESIKPDNARLETKGLRRGVKVQRSDRFVPIRKGAAGDIEMEVHSKGFGFWLKHLLGAVATTAANGDGASIHTGTIGSLLGSSFAAQINRPLHPAGTDQAFTWYGGKAAKWEIGSDVDGFLVVKLSCDFREERTDVALATAAYPSSTDVLSWAGCLLQVDSAEVAVSSIKITCDTGLKTDRYHQHNSTLKKEPVEAKRRDIGVEFECDFETMALRNKVNAAVASGAIGQLVTSWTGPIAIGGASYPYVTATIPATRWDEADVTVKGTDPLMQSVKGAGLYDGTNSPVTIAYMTADATP